MVRRVSIFLYGVFCYGVGLSALLYLIAFIGGYGASTVMDGPLTGPLATAVGVNLGLVLLFALQHSGMARPAFKRWWTRFIPAAAERSTYLLATGAALGVMFTLWRPMGGVVWDVENESLRLALHATYFVGWGLVFVASFLINHFDLFGLRQVWLHLKGRDYSDIPFSTPMLYSFIRHPIYAGVLIASWAAPTMGPAKLLFAVAITAYVLVAIRWEERDLIAHLGDTYEQYRRRVPMLMPRLFTKRVADYCESQEHVTTRG